MQQYPAAAHRINLPYVFEDRTGSTTLSDFDDIYDRLFFRIARVERTTSTLIYDMPRRASRHRDSQVFQRPPLISLDFMPDESLGTITLFHLNPLPIPMGRYLRKSSFMFGGSLSRKFLGSDGREYKWNHRVVAGQEWTCTTVAENYAVAHFDLKPPDVHVYKVSGNNFTISESFIHLAPELLATLTIMRHIAQYNL
ncbi:hypothetical protein C8J56DRAFT_278571 [Mycena floridula]|nr:hypothetical protein C8J56DRAFT_278571 [Mycena floridula]